MRKLKQDLAVHGWIYSIEDGILKNLNICIANAREIPDILEMNYPAASGEVSPKDEIYFIVASDGVLHPKSC